MQSDANIKAKCSKLTPDEALERNCIAAGGIEVVLVKCCEKKTSKSFRRIITDLFKKAVTVCVRICKIALRYARIYLREVAGRVECCTKKALSWVKDSFKLLEAAAKQPRSIGAKRNLVAARKKWRGVSDGFKVFGHRARSKTVQQFHSVKKFTSKVENRPILAMGGTCMTIAIIMFVLAFNFSIGFEAVVNGQSIGIVQSEEECVEVVNQVNDELSQHLGDENGIKAEITTVPRLIPKDGYTPKDELKSAVCQLSDKMQEMQVVYLDGKALFGVADEKALDVVMSGWRNYYTKGDDSITFSTQKQLEIKHELAPMVLLKNADAAINILNGSEKKENEYVIKPGDTLWAISEKYDTSVEELLQINEDLTEDIIDGQVITVKAYVPVVKVTTTQRAAYTHTVPYETKTVETANLYRGKTEIQQEGQNGSADVVATIVKENGQEVRRDIESSVTTKEPVECIKLVGTKEPPSGYGTGKFIAPATGTVTSRFGYRKSGFHKGIDIANSYGSPIRAADNGSVTTAGWSGLFGKLVILDHGNGYVSYYGHNSSIAVDVGDIVEKGDVIAYMGSTGNSTGNHCHFELHLNGTVLNPAKYIGL